MNESTLGEVFDTLNEEQRMLAYYLVGYAIETGRYYLAGNGTSDNHDQAMKRTIYNGMNPGQRLAVDLLVEKTIKEVR